MALSTHRAALAAALLGLPLAAAAQPLPPPTTGPVGTVTVDGMLNDAPYTLLATSAGGPAPGFGAGHEINALYASADPATGALTIGIAGNVQDGNRILVFLDTRAGGFASGDFGRTDAPAGAATFNSGTTFDAGFTADYVLVLGTNAAHDNFYADLFALAGTAATGGGTKLFIGDISNPDVGASPANGSTTEGFEVRLTTSADGVGADLALDRHSVQMFAAYTGDSGFLSNQFVTPGGPADGNYGDGAVTFENARPDPVSYVWQPIAGQKGWRQLAWPVEGGTVASYAAQNFVQGPGTAYPTGTSNVLLSYNPGTAEYTRAAGLTDPLTTGRGQFWYHYDAADFPGGVAPPAFRPRPYTLVAGGVEPQGNVGTNFSELPDTYTGFVMGGNPFSLDFDIQGLSTGSVGVGPLAYVWDPDLGAAGGYVTVDRNAAAVGDRTVAPMQGFWFETRTTQALAAPPARSFGSSLFAIYGQSARVQGNEAIVSRTAAQRVLAFQLDRLTEAGPVREWSTARLAFVEGAGDGRDAFDGGLPPALDAASDVRVAFVGEDGEMRGQLSRAYDAAASAAVSAAPLALRVAGRPAGTAYRLTWPTDGLTAASSVTLTDGDTGETVDLRAVDHYDFTASAGDWTSRFTVRVTPRSTAGEAGPAVAALGTPSPNPASGTTRVALSVDAPQHVRAELFDALGRRVAVVLDATVDASRDLTVDVQGLAPGVYLLRVSGDTFAASRQITVAR